jgi:hypothetical protein
VVVIPRWKDPTISDPIYWELLYWRLAGVTYGVCQCPRGHAWCYIILPPLKILCIAARRAPLNRRIF